MEKKYLIVNLGSASKKYSLYAGEREIFHAHFEKENNDFVVTEIAGSMSSKNKISQDEYDSSGENLLNILRSKNIVANTNEIIALGFRVVSPGEYFSSVKKIDDDYLEKLKEMHEIAPLHVEAVLAGINEFKKLLPDAPMIGVSDSAFHSTIPEVARLYALPIEDSRKYGIYRYGYHGISIASVLDAAGEMLGNLPSRIIVCHLGSGSSITAVKDGKSIDTSMGFTPLEGVVMATRGGDIDPGALIHLGKKLNLSFDELDNYLNHKCGLLGLSGGKESGVRELIELEKQGDEYAKIALNVWSYRVKKYIGAYIAALGGLDLLIFTATIGERSFIMRERICSDMENLGIILDKKQNNQFDGGKSGFINDEKSIAKISVVVTNEMKQIAKEIRGLVE